MLLLAVIFVTFDEVVDALEHFQDLQFHHANVFDRLKPVQVLLELGVDGSWIPDDVNSNLDPQFPEEEYSAPNSCLLIFPFTSGS